MAWTLLAMFLSVYTVGSSIPSRACMLQPRQNNELAWGIRAFSEKTNSKVDIRWWRTACLLSTYTTILAVSISIASRCIETNCVNATEASAVWIAKAKAIGCSASLESAIACLVICTLCRAACSVLTLSGAAYMSTFTAIEWVCEYICGTCWGSRGWGSCCRRSQSDCNRRILGLN